MENLSGLDPRGVAVLIRAYEPERKGGLIELPAEVAGRMAMLEHRAVVIAIGPNAWHDEPSPRAAVGDKVLVTKHAGFMAKGPLDGKQYRLVNDRDLFCVITDAEEAAHA